MQLNIKYNFYQLMPGIFLLEVDGNKELGMTFLRAQEFYESVNPAIQFQKFTLEQYVSWYKTQSKKGEFSYGEDWRGFNLPSYIIEKCYEVNDERTVWDQFFLSINQQCKELARTQGLTAYYLLGVRKGDTKTLDHEVAHGMYTVNDSYKKQMLEQVCRLPKDVRDYLVQWLENKGYAASVHYDEIQAFLSTGLSQTMEKEILQQHTKPFEQVFNQYVGKLVLPKPLVEWIV